MTQKPHINGEELRKGGIVRLREKDMYSVWVKTTCSNLNSNQLRKLADITDKYARSYLLFTTRQIPIIPFINLKDLEDVQEELSQVYLRLDRCGPRVRNINVCYEENVCPDAVNNSISLAEKLDNFFDVPLNYKLKIGISGCQKDCVISRVLTDIGFIGVERNGKKGFDVYFGGRLGLNPFVGLKMAECLAGEECTKFVQNTFKLLKNEGKEGERCADLINRMGVEKVKQKLIKNLSEGLLLKPIECTASLREKETDTMILRIRVTCGEVTSKQLRKIADITEKYGKGFIHFTVRGSPEIPCVAKGHLSKIRQELQEADLKILEKGIDNLQSCFGNYCSESNADPQSLLRRIERKVDELDLNNPNIRISAAGCPNSCGIAQLNDVGFYGVVEPEVNIANCKIGCRLCIPICKRKAIEKKEDLAVIDKKKCMYCGQCISVCPFGAIAEIRKGFAVFVGGKEGEDVKLGDKIAEFLSGEEALQLAEECMRIMKERNINAATIVDEVGLERFKEMLVPSH